MLASLLCQFNPVSIFTTISALNQCKISIQVFQILVKSCLVSLSKDKSRFSGAMTTVKEAAKLISHNWGTALSTVNAFQGLVEWSSPRPRWRVDDSKGESPGRVIGFSYETGMIGMLETPNNESLDMMSLFPGAIVDRFCRLDCSSIEKSFTLYVELLSFVNRRHLRAGWTKNHLQTLSKNKGDSNSEACRVFANGLVSGMETVKICLIEHQIKYLGSVRSIAFLHEGLYEFTHKTF